ncbi:MAG: hypothetical protein ACE5E5_08145 [Phycisphaerae bacterium]
MNLPTEFQLFVILVASAVVVGLGVLALWFFRRYEGFALESLKRRYADVEVHSDPLSGDVILTYHTYHGFVAWFTQIRHHVALPPDDARKLLGHLLRFNFKWGLVTYGAAFVPPLAILSYFAQRRSIAKQVASSGSNGSPPPKRPTLNGSSFL